MSVPKGRRNLSGLEFYRNAILLRKEISLFLLRDFGIKDKVRKVTYPSKDMSEEDSKLFDDLVEKYGITNEIDKYPEWIVDELRRSIMGLLRDLIMNITSANTIYPYYKSEFYERRNFHNLAIINCEQLYQELQYISTIVPVNAEKFTRYLDMIDREIFLLRGWKKSSNRLLDKAK